MSLEPTILSTLRNGDPTVAVAAELLHDSLEVLGRSVFVEQITVNRIRASSYDPYGGMRDGAVVFDLVMSASLPPKRRKVSIAVRVQEGVAYAPSTFTDSAGREHILSREAVVKHLGGMLGEYPCPKRMPRAFLGLTDRTLYPTMPARNFFMLAKRKTARHPDHEDDYLDSIWNGTGARLTTEEMLAATRTAAVDATGQELHVGDTIHGLADDGMYREFGDMASPAQIDEMMTQMRGTVTRIEGDNVWWAPDILKGEEWPNPEKANLVRRIGEARDWVVGLERMAGRPVLTTFSPQDAEEAMSGTGDTWSEVPAVSPDDLAQGMNTELEHSDLTGGDPVETAEIALDHLKEDPDYYAKLKAVESQGHVGNPGTPGDGSRPTLDEGAARSDEPWVQHMGPQAWGSEINTPAPHPNDRSGSPTPTSAG